MNFAEARAAALKEVYGEAGPPPPQQQPQTPPPDISSSPQGFAQAREAALAAQAPQQQAPQPQAPPQEEERSGWDKLLTGVKEGTFNPYLNTAAKVGLGEKREYTEEEGWQDDVGRFVGETVATLPLGVVGGAVRLARALHGIKSADKALKASKLVKASAKAQKRAKEQARLVKTMEKKAQKARVKSVTAKGTPDADETLKQFSKAQKEAEKATKKAESMAEKATTYAENAAKATKSAGKSAKRSERLDNKGIDFAADRLEDAGAGAFLAEEGEEGQGAFGAALTGGMLSAGPAALKGLGGGSAATKKGAEYSWSPDVYRKMRAGSNITKDLKQMGQAGHNANLKLKESELGKQMSGLLRRGAAGQAPVPLTPEELLELATGGN